MMFRRKALADSQAKLDALARSQALVEFALDGTVLSANQNFLNVLGYKLEEIKGKHHSMFVPAEQRQSSEYREFWAALKRAEYQMAEFKRIAKDGHDVWIEASYNPVLDDNGKPIVIVKFATDVTQKKLRSLADASKIAAVNRAQATIEFKLDGTIVTANENFLKTMGYSLPEIQGRHHSMFIEQAERDMDRALALRGGESRGAQKRLEDFGFRCAMQLLHLRAEG